MRVWPRNAAGDACPALGEGAAGRLTSPRAQAMDRAMISTFLQVAIGGAIGSCLRYGAGLALLRLAGPGLPLGVLVVNVLGSFLMGAFAVLSLERGMAHLGPLLMAGLLGGFTTFSAFSLEAVTLAERGAMGLAALYVGLSIGLSIGALILGAALTRAALA
jgi:CrcB protein